MGAYSCPQPAGAAGSPARQVFGEIMRLFLRFGAAGDGGGRVAVCGIVLQCQVQRLTCVSSPESRAGAQRAQQSRHQTGVGPVPGISRQESHARVSPVWCGWGHHGCVTERASSGGEPLQGEPSRSGGSSHKELCGPVLLLPSVGWNRGRREWASAQGHGLLPHPVCERSWNGCVVVQGQESPPRAALPSRGLLQGCSHPQLRPHLPGKGGGGNSIRCCHGSPEHGSLPVPLPPRQLGIPGSPGTHLRQGPRPQHPFSPCRCGEAVWQAERRRVGTRRSLSQPGEVVPAPCASPPAPGARQVPVAAVTVSMETGPAQLHPGDRGKGRPWGCVPLPTGARWLPGCAQREKMEIPQVASVWRNPKETNWFSPTPPLMLVGFHSTLVIAALHLLKGRLMLCTGSIVN